MSEPTLPLTPALPDWLPDLGPDTYALAWVNPGTDPLGSARAPVAGLAGVERPDFGHRRLELEETAHGPQETLRRWMLIEDGQRHLAIIGADAEDGTLREYTPGALTVLALTDSPTDQGPLTSLLSDWLYRRSTEAPQGLELGWVTAAAAWSCHMRDVAYAPPPAVVARALANAGDQDEATEELIATTALNVTGLLARAEGTHRTRDALAEDWQTLEALTVDVPVLRETADWLLDEVARRDRDAQRLRAVLEPEVTDYLVDRRAGGRSPSTPRPVLDPQRAAQLERARETVRAYTAAAYGGREHLARHLADSLDIPARSVEPSGPAAAWRSLSFTARDAVAALDEQRRATFAEDGPDYSADPELLHATIAYLTAREAHLQHLHDTMGQLAVPAALPDLMPQELTDVLAGQTARRIIGAFGSIDRAAQALDGQITYLQQQPVPSHRRDTTHEEIGHLRTVRHNLEPQPIRYDAGAIRRRVEAMGRVSPAPRWVPRPERPALTEAQSQALTQNSTAPGIQP